nr:gag-like protein [Danio rerio]
MAAPGSGSFNELTRRHGVKIDSTASIEECGLAVGEEVGHDNILSASRMNGAVVVFVKTVDLANLLVQNGIVINGIFTPVLPLSTPSKKVTLSNVPPFIPNEVLTNLLKRYGKIVSPIKMIPIGTKSPLLKHVVSFRRYVYMVLQEHLDELDLSLNFRHEDFNYVIFATTNNVKCFNCGGYGHLIRGCPNKVDNKSNEATLPVATDESDARQENQTAAAQVVEEEAPGPSSGQTAAVLTEPGNIEERESVDRAVDEEDMIVTGDEMNEVENVSTAAEAVVSELFDQREGAIAELDDNLFKTPQKRRREQCPLNERAKRGAGDEPGQTDTESERDFSECSVSFSLPLSGYSSKNYTAHEIKTFLKDTKNARNIRIEQYFPDVRQFIDKVRIYRNEGCFNKQEVFRLRKFIGKINEEMESSASNEN